MDDRAYRVKLLPGMHRFVAVHNGGRREKRAAAVPVPPRLDEIALFRPALFHFGRVRQAECLFIVATLPHADHYDSLVPESCVAFDATDPIHPVLLNKWPLGPTSGLLVPFVGNQRPQQLSEPALLAALVFARALDDPFLRVGCVLA